MSLLNLSETKSNIFSKLLETDQLCQFVALIEATGIKEELITGGKYTVLAPLDEAFETMSQDQIHQFQEALKDPVSARKLLRTYLINGSCTTEELLKRKKVKSLKGDEFTIKQEGDSIFVENAKIQIPDIQCTNGILHIINSLL
ncbi:MAG: fasciclin domain-containing protein [Aquificae bacterium]|nr:fasciclin domain-containing protein [Aquificota bacterium]